MTFREIVDAVLSDRFSESQRADAKVWVQHRYWWLWTLEPWTFKQGTDLVTITAGSQTVTGLATDVLSAHALIGPDGPLAMIPDPRVFYAEYLPTSTEVGQPEAFTMVGSTVIVGPIPDTSSTDQYTLVYEKEFTPLAEDSDVPALPPGSHFALVHGGCAEGLKLQNDPTWQSFEQDFQATLTVLRQGYLSSMKGAATQFGAYRPEQWA